MEYMIQVTNASFSYGNKEIFRGINFNIKQGEVFCILGPNGCGKTTLISCILGLQKIKEGHILIDGVNIDNIKPKSLAEKTAYVPQIHERTFPYKVKDIVLMGRAHNTSLFTSPSQMDKEIAMMAIEKVGIMELAEQPYTQISGGQCQLVMIARALAQQPKVIIMDEPTSHLDFKNELMVLETIADLVKNEKISVLMATHFPNHAYYFESNNVPATLALMNNGEFEDSGIPSDILNEKNILKTYQINSKLIDYKVNENMSIKQIVPLSIKKDWRQA